MRILGGQSKISNLDDHLSLAPSVRVCRPPICHDKVLRLDIPMEDRVVVTGRYRLAHLGEHRRYEAQTSAGEQLRRCKGREQARARRCAGATATRVRGWSRREVRGQGIDFIVIAGLFQEIEEIFTWHKLEEEKQK